MSVLPANRDAFGAAMSARWRTGDDVRAVIERDDGMVDSDSLDYSAPFRRWPAHERRAMRHIGGRVLDVGCASGRVALHLDSRGHSVVSIDVSPGALGPPASAELKMCAVSRRPRFALAMGRSTRS